MRYCLSPRWTRMPDSNPAPRWFKVMMGLALWVVFMLVMAILVGILVGGVRAVW